MLTCLTFLPSPIVCVYLFPPCSFILFNYPVLLPVISKKIIHHNYNCIDFEDKTYRVPNRCCLVDLDDDYWICNFLYMMIKPYKKTHGKQIILSDCKLRLSYRIGHLLLIKCTILLHGSDSEIGK